MKLLKLTPPKRPRLKGKGAQRFLREVADAVPRMTAESGGIVGTYVVTVHARGFHVSRFIERKHTLAVLGALQVSTLALTREYLDSE